MAIRQYIGARYVPRFIGTYDATQIYEALDVVDNGSGTSYIARKTVPAGTPLTDSEYWFVYGSASGAIVQLQNDMITAQGDIITLQGDMTNAQGDIGALQTDMTNAQNAIAALQTLTPSNILIIGNSFVNRGVTDQLADMFEHVYKKTEGGLGFVAYTGHANTFETLLANAVSDPSIDNDTITDIIFVSAAGDGRAITEFGETAYENALITNLASIENRITSNFVNCSRVCVTLADSRSVAYFNDATYTSIFATHRIFRRVMDAVGFDYIGWSGWNALMDATCFESDNLHPNTKGAKVIGSFIKGSYLGHVDYQKKYSRATVSYKYTNSGTGTIIGELLPDIFNLQVRDITVTSGQPVTAVLHDIFMNTGNLPVPLPAPSYYAKDLYCDIISTIGDAQDWLHFLLEGDSNGILQLQIASNPKASTALANKLCVPLLATITYF